MAGAVDARRGRSKWRCDQVLRSAEVSW